MRLIDADALEYDTEWSEYHDGFTAYSQMAIDTAPSMDAVSVVLCRDCKWFATDNLGEDYCSLSKGLCWVDDGTFCSYGERGERWNKC